MSDTSTDKVPVVKKEWYCTLPKWSDERSLVIGIFAVLFVIWAIAVAVAFLIGEPALDAAPFLLRGLIIIIVYVMLCAAFFLRRREVRE